MLVECYNVGIKIPYSYLKYNIKGLCQNLNRIFNFIATCYNFLYL